MMAEAQLTERDYAESARQGEVARRAVVTNLEMLAQIETLVKDAKAGDHEAIDAVEGLVQWAAEQGYYFARGFAYRNHLHVLKLKHNPYYDPKRDGGIA